MTTEVEKRTERERKIHNTGLKRRFLDRVLCYLTYKQSVAQTACATSWLRFPTRRPWRSALRHGGLDRQGS
jgi:hypothetical protein